MSPSRAVSTCEGEVNYDTNQDRHDHATLTRSPRQAASRLTLLSHHNQRLDAPSTYRTVSQGTSDTTAHPRWTRGAVGLASR